MDSKVQLMIFSYNRPMQLDLLVSSIRKNITGFDKILVTFNYAHDKFLEGYKKFMKKGLVDEWHCDKDFAYTAGFKDYLVGLMGTKYEYTCLFSDDAIVYGKASMNEITALVKDDVISFSLRTGLNTTYSFYGGKTVIENPWGKYEDLDKFIKWDWTEYNPKRCNGYPIGFGDGCTFKTQTIRSLLKRIEGQSPNEIERHLNNVENRELITQKKLVAYKHSALVSNPVNNVQTFSPLFSGERFSYPVEKLNDKYLEGYVVDFDKIDFSDIKATHQELALALKLSNNGG